MSLILSYDELEQKLGLDSKIQVLRFDYATGKERLEILFIGEEVISKGTLYPINKWHCKHCGHNWEEPGIANNCPNCTSDCIEEGIDVSSVQND